jgi:hypothetical protein
MVNTYMKIDSMQYDNCVLTKAISAEIDQNMLQMNIKINSMCKTANNAFGK